MRQTQTVGRSGKSSEKSPTGGLELKYLSGFSNSCISKQRGPGLPEAFRVARRAELSAWVVRGREVRHRLAAGSSRRHCSHGCAEGRRHGAGSNASSYACRSRRGSGGSTTGRASWRRLRSLRDLRGLLLRSGLRGWIGALRKGRIPREKCG